MNFGKKIAAFLIVVCLLFNMVPAAFAVGTEVRLSAATDYSGLKKQVAIVNGLNAYDYTGETWEMLQDAAKKGSTILKGSHSQKVVNDAAAAIEKALGALVKMDYSALDTALAKVYSKIEEAGTAYDVWYQLTAVAEAARSQMVSGNQETVNKTADQLNELLAELEQCEDPNKKAEIVIQEVEVEVLPKDDFCNIPMHRTWPVLFVVSAVLNVALAVMLVYVIMRKRQTADTTPLVSYDIEDDLDY